MSLKPEVIALTFLAYSIRSKSESTPSNGCHGDLNDLDEGYFKPEICFIPILIATVFASYRTKIQKGSSEESMGSYNEIRSGIL
jgi:hypothetical protein